MYRSLIISTQLSSAQLSVLWRKAIPIFYADDGKNTGQTQAEVRYVHYSH